MGYLNLIHGHTMYYEIHGNPKGKPVVILHGGPGGGMSQKHLMHFNLKKWFVVMFDQRGCGKSTPSGLESLKHNTTQLLVEDIEILRTHLKFDKWFVFGGSWGTTLGIVYAETHPKSVSGLLLRSVCLLKPCEYKWLYDGETGASQIYPKEWQKFISIIKAPYTYKNIFRSYRKLLTDTNLEIKQTAAKLWSNWENAVSFLKYRPNNDSLKEMEEVSIIENHYFYHDAWLKPNQIIRDAYKLVNIPVTIIHGRYDMVCPIKASWEFVQAVPHAKFTIISDAGHATTEPGTRKALKKFTNSIVNKRTTRKII